MREREGYPDKQSGVDQSLGERGVCTRRAGLSDFSHSSSALASFPGLSSVHRLSLHEGWMPAYRASPILLSPR